MNYLIQTVGLLLFSSFIVSCSDHLGTEIVKGVRESVVEGSKVSALLSEQQQKLRQKGHQSEIQWSHRKMTDGTYEILAEMRVPGAPKLGRTFEWKAQKTPTQDLNHWLVRASNSETKRLVSHVE